MYKRLWSPCVVGLGAAQEDLQGFLSEFIREVSGMGVLLLVVAMKGRLHKLGL